MGGGELPSISTIRGRRKKTPVEAIASARHPTRAAGQNKRAMKMPGLAPGRGGLLPEAHHSPSTKFGRNNERTDGLDDRPRRQVTRAGPMVAGEGFEPSISGV